MILFIVHRVWDKSQTIKYRLKAKSSKNKRKHNMIYKSKNLLIEKIIIFCEHKSFQIL